MNVQFEHEEGRLFGIVTQGTSHPTKGVLMLHPHPLYGGNMNSHVILSLEKALSRIGLTTLRFDFRGGGSSTSHYSGPGGAILDALSAISFMRDRLAISQLGVIGYSFGGSITLGLGTKTNIDFITTISASMNILAESGVSHDDLNRISVPALLVHGSDDRVVPFSDMERISSKLGGAVESFIVNSEGHFYNSSLDIVIKRVLAFICMMWGTN